MTKVYAMRFFPGLKCLCGGVSSYISRKVSPVCGRLWAGQWMRSCSRTSQIMKEGNQDSIMLKHLISKIKSTGPISVAEYMREVLTNPVTGYYQHRDVLGPQGDFITSPEISQIFGELLGVWCISEWMAAGKPKTFQLVELGPGRGTLASDALRVFSQLNSVLKESEISVHLVEVSPKLGEVQAQLLTEGEQHLRHDPNAAIYKTGTTKTGLPISWYKDLQDVPRGFSFYIAHEFFDVLPIHKFQRDDERDHIEICPEAGIIVQNLASRITEDGGAALIADYGHNGTKTDTFRGFRGHQQHDVLTTPGTADLTADVDFSYLRQMTKGKVTSLGPIPQHEFLKNMGIDVRLQVLLRNTSDPATSTGLIDAYDMIMNPEKMGNRFKFFALLPCDRLISSNDTRSKKHGPTAPPVAGFSELQL
ncbi:protein arginine methyltransferase NDUFAF7, mitochondrial isoform X2 [Hemiscyllium ocellatum]|uniref:protein arginine methyltransferase NDUFAF7, mitochondrial isoform X2 n=1 Tax=Hemiscyllium ocellatum TaxID=170820 RepID=UPI00296743C4|nr:protein arginine methyltransferase NDUFAF7, mitochondrial isoform X2 [Hemiscyllium ocellatum]